MYCRRFIKCFYHLVLLVLQVQVVPARGAGGPGGEDPGAGPTLDEGLPRPEGYSHAARQVILQGDTPGLRLYFADSYLKLLAKPILLDLQFVTAPKEAGGHRDIQIKDNKILSETALVTL